MEKMKCEFKKPYKYLNRAHVLRMCPFYYKLFIMWSTMVENVLMNSKSCHSIRYWTWTTDSMSK